MWKSKGGFERFTEDDYLITMGGNVLNKKWGRFVKPQPNGKGYLRVTIAGRMRFVHRMVAERYVPNPNNLPQVNHKDGDKKNNRYDNLEWVTNLENRRHAIEHGLHTSGEDCSWAKLKKKDVLFIRNHPEISSAEFSEMYGVTKNHITAVRNRRSWKNV